MSIECLNFAIDAETSHASDKVILILLANYASDNYLAFPSVETLSRKSRLNEKTVRLSLKRLTKSGFISETGKKIGGTQQVKIYKVNLKVPKIGYLQNQKVPNNGVKGTQNRTSKVPKIGHQNHHLTNNNHNDLLDNKCTPEMVSQKLDELNELFNFRKAK